MRFGILGTLRAAAGGESVDLGWPKQRALLAALLLTPNRVVSRADLTVALWGPNPPASATNGLQKYVSALRRALGPSRVLTRAPGYLIAVEPSELDLLEFEELAAAEKWGDALALWRGEPCEDVELLGPWQAHLDALRERRDDLRGRVLDQRLAAGEHESLIPELKALVHADPLREQHWARLMRAQHRAGRTAQALATYADLRALLADELGIDPSAELRDAHQEMLVQNYEAGSQVAAGRTSTSAPWNFQCQLPLDVADFVGREEVERKLKEVLTGTGVPIAVIHGPPGVGKTALAVRIAHQLRNNFPDGQWFVRLRGAGTAPVDPSSVLASILRASGLDGDSLPRGLDSRAAAFRARLADRKVLLVLDDAVDVSQVRWLFPGTGGTAVVVTSRNELVGLAALDGAKLEGLDSLSLDSAAALLDGTLRRTYVDIERCDLFALAELCGRLPLALRIAAANLSRGPGRTIGSYVDELKQEGRLAKLAVHGEDRLAVRAAFDLSYKAQSSGARRAFRLLGLLPVSEFPSDVAASILDVEVVQAEAWLATLVASSLLQEKTAGRFQFHDLIRLYALERAAGEEAPGTYDDALQRMSSWFVHTALNARIQLNPHRRPDAIDPLYGTAPPREFADYRSALLWIRSEKAALMAVLRSAHEMGAYRTVWHLAILLVDYFLITGETDEWQESHHLALEACRKLGARLGEAHVLNGLGILSETLLDSPSAEGYFERALHIRAVEGDWQGVANVLTNMVVTMTNLGKYDEAERLGHLSVEIAAGLDVASRSSDQPLSVHAIGWANLAYNAVHDERYEQALGYAEKALSLWSQLYAPGGGAGAYPAAALHNLGTAYAGLGRSAEAKKALQETFVLAEDAGRCRLSAESLMRLGDVSWADGAQVDAVTNWRRAYQMMVETRHQLAPEVLERLRAAGVADEDERSHPQAPNG